METATTHTSKYYANEPARQPIRLTTNYIAVISAISALFLGGYVPKLCKWSWKVRPLLVGGAVLVAGKLLIELLVPRKSRPVKFRQLFPYQRKEEEPEKRVVGWPKSIIASLGTFPVYQASFSPAESAGDLPRVWIESPLWENGRSTLLLHAYFLDVENSKELVVISLPNGVTADGIHGLAAKFKEQGHSVLVWDYPGYGFSEGTPTYDSCIAGAQRVAEVAQELADGKPLWFFGWSLGGPHAAEMATRVKNPKLTLDRTFANMGMAASGMVSRRIGPIAQWLFPYDTAASVKKLGPEAKLLIHWGKHDTLFGPAHGKALHRASPGNSTLSSTDSGHMDLSKQYFTLLFDENSHT